MSGTRMGGSRTLVFADQRPQPAHSCSSAFYIFILISSPPTVPPDSYPHLFIFTHAYGEFLIVTSLFPGTGHVSP